MATTTALPSKDDVESGDLLKYTMDYKELDLADLKATLPKSVAKKIDQSFVDNFNSTVKDPNYREQIKANYLGYIHVIQGGKYKAMDYLNAVKFCTFILAGYNNKDAYYLAFPDRARKFVANAVQPKDIQNLVNGYKRGKLVKTILEQSITPSWIVNQDVYQDAINAQYKLMKTAKSEMVRQNAAACLISELSPPKETKMSIGVSEGSKDTLDSLTSAIRQYSELQSRSLNSGNSTLKDVAHSQIVDADYEEV